MANLPEHIKIYKVDINKIRQDTKGCHDKIFLNSAGSALMPASVVHTMQEYLEAEEMIGGYLLAAQREQAIARFKIETATLLHAQPHNIAFAASATDAFATALSSIPFKKGDVVVISNNDYSSNQIALMQLTKRFGIEVIRCKHNEEGDIALEEFEHILLTKHPKLVTISHVPTNSGIVQQAKEVGALCKKYDILFLLDACQSVGQMDVNVQELHCDFLTATGRKFLRGPRGTGFLYVSDKVLEQGYTPLFVDQYGADWTAADSFTIQKDADRFETWEKNVGAQLGLAEAVRYLNEVGIEAVEKRNIALQLYCREKLATVAGLILLDKGIRKSNIITFHHQKHSIGTLAKKLTEANIYYSTTGKSSAFIDFSLKGVEEAIRFSPHYYNTFEEIDEAVGVLAGMV